MEVAAQPRTLDAALLAAHCWFSVRNPLNTREGQYLRALEPTEIPDTAHRLYKRHL